MVIFEHTVVMDQMPRASSLMYMASNPDQAMSKKEFSNWYAQSCKIRDDGLQGINHEHPLHVYEVFEIVVHSIFFLNYLPATGIVMGEYGPGVKMFYADQVINKIRDIYSSELELVKLIRQRASRDLGKDSPEYLTNMIDTYEKFCHKIELAVGCYI